MALAAVMFFFILRIHGKVNRFIFVFVSFSTLFAILCSSCSISNNVRKIKALEGTEATIYGTVASVPKKGDDSVTFYVNAVSIHHVNGVIKDKTKIYVTADGDYGLKFGDRIKFNGSCERSYSYYEKSNYTFIAKGAPIKSNITVLLDKKPAVFPDNIVANLRNYILKIGDEFFDGETAMLFKALVAGDKSNYSSQLANKMSVAGISHIAAVSGLHVSVLGLFVYNLIHKKNRLVATILSMGIVVLFSLVTGASPSTVRAGIMFVSFILSKLFISENDSVTALSLSAMLLCVANPYVIYDWGFILSFLSVLGILIFYAPVQRMFGFLPQFLSESVAMTLSAQIMTFPALTNMFGEISLYSVAANIVVSTFFTVTLCMSILFVPISPIPYINRVFAFAVKILTDAVINVAGIFLLLPFNMIYADAFNVCEHIVYYGVTAVFAMRKKVGEYMLSAIMLLFVFILVLGAYILKI